MAKEFTPNFKYFKLIHDSIKDGFGCKTVWKNCQDYEMTLVITKSNYGVTLGGLSKVKWDNF